MDAHCSERWLIVGDLTDSTLFQARLLDLHAKSPDAFFRATFDLAHTINSLIDDAKINMVTRLPRVRLGNTMGDGFMLVGHDGHGVDHIRPEAPAIVDATVAIKTQMDKNLRELRTRVNRAFLSHDVESTLPELKLKLTVHHGYMVTDPSEEPRIVRKNPSIKRFIATQRYLGDTINYCCRVASAAFQPSYRHGIVLTNRFYELVPDDLRFSERTIEVRNYPGKGDAFSTSVFCSDCDAG